MAAIQRRKSDRNDQPALFGGKGGPVVIPGTVESKKKHASESAALVVNKNKITTNPDAGDDDAEPPAGKHITSQPTASSGSFARNWYTAPVPGAVLDIEHPDTVATLQEAGHYRLAAYVAKSLHCVAVGGAVYDMPDSLLVRFTGEEHPAPVRECFLLTVDLYEMILGRCAAAEGEYEAGKMTDVNWRILCHRMRDRHGVNDMAARYATARDFQEPAQSPVPSPSV